jgi:hypothetical protein
MLPEATTSEAASASVLNVHIFAQPDSAIIEDEIVLPVIAFRQGVETRSLQTHIARGRSLAGGPSE